MTFLRFIVLDRPNSAESVAMPVNNVGCDNAPEEVTGGFSFLFANFFLGYAPNPAAPHRPLPLGDSIRSVLSMISLAPS